MGIGGGLTYIPSAAIIAQYFSKRRALAMTVVATGSSLGSVIHPIMLNNTLGTRLSFGNAVRASAGLVGGLLLLACCLLRTRVPVNRHVDMKRVVKKASKDWAFIMVSLA